MRMDNFDMLSNIINVFGIDSKEAKILSKEIAENEYSETIEKIYYRIIG